MHEPRPTLAEGLSATLDREWTRQLSRRKISAEIAAHTSLCGMGFRAGHWLSIMATVYNMAVIKERFQYLKTPYGGNYNVRMSNPPTMFDVVTGVISQLQNVSANIHQSTQDRLVQIHKNLDEFGKAMAKGMAKAETEAFDILQTGRMAGPGAALHRPSAPQLSRDLKSSAIPARS